MKKIILIVILAAGMIQGCHKNPSEPIPPVSSPTIDGTWQGSGIKNGFQYTITADLFQTDTSVAGSGNIAVLFASVDFTAKGSNIYPKVVLNMANADSSFIGTFDGEFDQQNDNKITGRASVPAFSIVGDSLTIKRIGN